MWNKARNNTAKKALLVKLGIFYADLPSLSNELYKNKTPVLGFNRKPFKPAKTH